MGGNGEIPVRSRPETGPRMNPWVPIRSDAAHMDRERMRARELRRSEWWRRETERGRCHYCGRQVVPSSLTMDHRVPVARGGRSTRGNVVPCCPDCNRAKGCLTRAEQVLSALENHPAADPAPPTTPGE